MLGHLLLEDLLQNYLNAFPDPGLYVAFHVMLELALRGQAPPSSLNPQLTRRYPGVCSCSLCNCQISVNHRRFQRPTRRLSLWKGKLFSETNSGTEIHWKSGFREEPYSDSSV